MMPNSSSPVDELSSVDPVDVARLTAAWSESDVKQEIFTEVTGAPTDALTTSGARRTGRWSLPRVAAAVAVTAAALVVVQGVFSFGDPAFAVRELQNGLIEVKASDDFRNGDALAAELRAYGIDVEMVTTPASPSSVGRVAVFAPGGGEYIPDGLTFGQEGTADVFNWTIDPDAFTETLTIQMHVAAQEGEPYVIAEGVFELGEALGGLHCALGQPVRAEDVQPYLAELGITPIWLVISPTEDPTVIYEEQVSDTPAGQVMWGHSIDATTVELSVLPDGTNLSADHQPRLSDVPCSADQAEAWSR
jgi:hypothetical protein